MIQIETPHRAKMYRTPNQLANETNLKDDYRQKWEFSPQCTESQKKKEVKYVYAKDTSAF